MKICYQNPSSKQLPTKILQGKDQPVLQFIDHNRMNGALHVELSLIIIVTIADLSIITFPVENKSFCSILYVDTYEQLGLRQLNLSSCICGNLLAFDNFVTYSCRTRDLTLSLGEIEIERNVALGF